MLSDPLTIDARERGLLVIISSPSGAGKTTLSRLLLAEFPSMQFSVSYTTRPMRRGERPGVDYNFVDRRVFDTMIAGEEFAEWAVVHGNHYGTSRTAVESALSGGTDVVFDVDYQGARALRDKWPDDALSIFILPPSLQSLEQRLRSRATDDEDVIRRRLRKAHEELLYHKEYANRIVNDDVDEAYEMLRAVYIVHRHGTAGAEAGSQLTLAERARGADIYAHAESIASGDFQQN